jgi:hypothetical protein
MFCTKSSCHLLFVARRKNTTTCAFREAIRKNWKTHNLLIGIQILHILVCGNPLKNIDKIHKKTVILIIINSVSS